MTIAARQLSLTDKKVFISCIVPVFNEQEVIHNFLNSLVQELTSLTEHYEIIIIDDGSRDHTMEIIQTFTQHAPIKILRFSRNFGKEIAITAGLDHAKGEVSIIIDADGQHPLTLLPQFLQQWAQGYDMVYGIRQHREGETIIKRIFTKMFYSLMQKMTKTTVPANAGDFRLLDQKVVTALNTCGERNRFMKGLYGWVGFKSIELPYAPHERAGGKSSFHFRKLIELAITGITSFSSIPLRVWSFMGFVISLISLTYAVIIIFDTLIYGVDVPGFATLAVAIMFFGGIQLLSIGILGEYIGRIFDEVKQRPKYIIAEKIGFPTDDKT